MTLCTWCYMQLVQCVLAYLWYGASCPSLGAPRTTYVSEAALCTLCSVRYVHSIPVCSAVAVLLFAPHVACARPVVPSCAQGALVPAPRAHLNCIASLGRCASLAWIPVILSAVRIKICFPLLRAPQARARRNARTTRRAACQRVSRQHRRRSVFARRCGGSTRGSRSKLFFRAAGRRQ